MGKTLTPIARVIIGLHEEGYHDDFKCYGTDQLWGFKENRAYTAGEININKISSVQDPDGKSGKLILAIETTDGCKGLLIGTATDNFLNEDHKKQVS